MTNPADRLDAEHLSNLSANRVQRSIKPEQSIAKSEAADDNPIKHIVIVMLENRSFDLMLGSLPWLKHDSETSGGVMFDKRPSKKDPHTFNDSSGKPLAPNEPTDNVIEQLPLAFTLDTGDKPHHHQKVRMSLNILGYTGPDGHVAAVELGDLEDVNSAYNPHCTINYAALCTPPRLWLINNNVFRRHEVMSYLPYGALPVMHKLAAEFVVCDRYFSSLPADTWPNRLFATLGTSDGWISAPDGLWKAEQGLGFNHFSIYSQQGVPFQSVGATCYTDNQASGNDDGVPHIWSSVLKPSLLISHDSLDDFRKDCKNGKLPPVSWIEPTFAGLTAQDQHPPHNLHNGERFLAEIYDAVRSNDATWKSTLLIVTYDEHGGYYDHVDPRSAGPAMPPDNKFVDFGALAKGEGPFGFNMYGVRVPCLLISPWVKKGAVDSTIYDHTSLIKQICKTFDYTTFRYKSARLQSAEWFGKGDTFLPDARTDCVSGADILKLMPGYTNTRFPWEEEPGSKDVKAYRGVRLKGVLSAEVSVTVRLIISSTPFFGAHNLQHRTASARETQIQISVTRFVGSVAAPTSGSIESVDQVIEEYLQPCVDFSTPIRVVSDRQEVAASLVVTKEGKLRISPAEGVTFSGNIEVRDTSRIYVPSNIAFRECDTVFSGALSSPIHTPISVKVVNDSVTVYLPPFSGNIATAGKIVGSAGVIPPDVRPTQPVTFNITLIDGGNPVASSPEFPTPGTITIGTDGGLTLDVPIPPPGLGPSGFTGIGKPAGYKDFKDPNLSGIAELVYTLPPRQYNGTYQGCLIKPVTVAHRVTVSATQVFLTIDAFSGAIGSHGEIATEEAAVLPPEFSPLEGQLFSVKVINGGHEADGQCKVTSDGRIHFTCVGPEGFTSSPAGVPLTTLVFDRREAESPTKFVSNTSFAGAIPATLSQVTITKYGDVVSIDVEDFRNTLAVPGKIVTTAPVVPKELRPVGKNATSPVSVVDGGNPVAQPPDYETDGTVTVKTDGNIEFDIPISPAGFGPTGFTRSPSGTTAQTLTYQPPPRVGTYAMLMVGTGAPTLNVTATLVGSKVTLTFADYSGATGTRLFAFNDLPWFCRPCAVVSLPVTLATQSAVVRGWVVIRPTGYLDILAESPFDRFAAFSVTYKATYNPFPLISIPTFDNEVRNGLAPHRPILITTRENIKASPSGRFLCFNGQIDQDDNLKFEDLSSIIARSGGLANAVWTYFATIGLQAGPFPEQSPEMFLRLYRDVHAMQEIGRGRAVAIDKLRGKVQYRTDATRSGFPCTGFLTYGGISFADRYDPNSYLGYDDRSVVTLQGRNDQWIAVDAREYLRSLRFLGVTQEEVPYLPGHPAFVPFTQAILRDGISNAVLLTTEDQWNETTMRGKIMVVDRSSGPPFRLRLVDLISFLDAGKPTADALFRFTPPGFFASGYVQLANDLSGGSSGWALQYVGSNRVVYNYSMQRDADSLWLYDVPTGSIYGQNHPDYRLDYDQDGWVHITVGQPKVKWRAVDARALMVRKT